MKCIVCKKELSNKQVIMYSNKSYCKKCYDRIPKGIEIVPINPLYDDKDSKPLM